MSRARLISPEFWTSEAVVDDTPMARLLLLGLSTFVDHFDVSPRAEGGNLSGAMQTTLTMEDHSNRAGPVIETAPLPPQDRRNHGRP